jgi:5-hydroxyisourate hydrolase
MAAGLTTHVLDTSREGPAKGVPVTLHRLEDGGVNAVIGSGRTNDDGRLDEPLLSPSEIESGVYQLLFEVGEYYREQSRESTFLDVVPVRFVVDDPTEHYHVPLLVSPGGYTTYRGS